MSTLTIVFNYTNNLWNWEFLEGGSGSGVYLPDVPTGFDDSSLMNTGPISGDIEISGINLIRVYITSTQGLTRNLQPGDSIIIIGAGSLIGFLDSNNDPLSGDGTYTFNGTSFTYSSVTPCIHSDMNIDMANITISELSERTNQEKYINNLSRVLTMGYAREFVCIKKNALSCNSPNIDLMLTPEHPIKYGNKYIKCGTLVNNETITLVRVEKPVKIYALEFVDNVNKTIKMHNVDVLQWSVSDFKVFQDRYKCVYKHGIGMIKLPNKIYRHNN